MLKLLGSLVIIFGLTFGGEWGLEHEYLGQRKQVSSRDAPFRLDEDSVDPDGRCVDGNKCQNGGYCFQNATMPIQCKCPPGYSGNIIVKRSFFQFMLNSKSIAVIFHCKQETLSSSNLTFT